MSDSSKPKMPAWKRHLIGWPILIIVATLVGKLITGLWLAGIAFMAFAFSCMIGVACVAALFCLVFWMFDMDNGPSGID